MIFLAFHAFGCDRAETQIRERKAPPPGSLFVVIGPYDGHPDWKAIAGGARKFATSLGQYSFDYVVPRINHALIREELVRDVLKRRPVAICLYVCSRERPSFWASTTMPSSEDEASYVKIVHEIRNSGTVLVTMGRQLESLPISAHIGINRREAAQLIGERMPELLQGKHSVLLWHQNGRDAESSAGYDRFLVALHQHADITLLDECNGFSEYGAVREQIDALTARFTNAGLLVTLDSEPWVTPKPRCELPAGMRFATIGSAPQLWQRLRDGDAAALAGPVAGAIGYKALQAAWALLTGGETGQVTTVPCELVTSGNLDGFIKRYADAAGMDASLLQP